METIVDLLTSASKYRPNKPIIIFGEDVYTYKYFDEETNRIANSLKSLGIKNKDRIALFLPSKPIFCLCSLAIMKLGAIVAPFNYMFKEIEIERMLRVTNCRTIITTERGCKILSKIVNELNTLKDVILVKTGEDNETDANLDFIDFEELVRNKSTEFEKVYIDFDDVALLMHTSGTTGIPKCIMETHKNIVINGRNHVCMLKYTMDEEVIICPLPIYNNYGFTIQFISALTSIATFVMIEKWDTGKVYDSILRYHGTRIGGTPTMYVYMLRGYNKEIHNGIKLENCQVAGQKCTKEIIEQFEETFKTRLIDSYGASETAWATSNPASGIHKLGSAGTTIGNSKVFIVDNDLNILPAKEIGEVIINNDSVASGYWNNPEATKQSFTTLGWRSGDLGYLDEDGYLYIVDRKKDMIITGGANIYPADIEEVLYTHPKISIASIVGIPDKEKGEIPVAYVICKEGKTATEEEIIEFCRNKMAVYKAPRRVKFVNSIPLGPTGKILKNELRSLAAKDLAK